MKPLLRVGGLCKTYATRSGPVQAISHVDFDIMEGETVALVGESGCGKTTVALTLLRLIDHDGGEVFFEDKNLDTLSKRERQKLRRRLSIVFQNPYSSLNPKMKIRDIVGEPLKTAFGLRGRELTKRVQGHLSEVGLTPEHMNRYPHEFSGGQRQRIAIARALALEPRLLILDEPTSALDVSVQAQVLNLLCSLQRKRGLSYLVISHNLAVVAQMADRVMVMYLGRIVETGAVKDIFAKPAHPYTRALLDSIPSPDPLEREHLRPITGEIPSALKLPAGCYFAPRCDRADAPCWAEFPPLTPRSTTRSVACCHPLTEES